MSEEIRTEPGAAGNRQPYANVVNLEAWRAGRRGGNSRIPFRVVSFPSEMPCRGTLPLGGVFVCYWCDRTFKRGGALLNHEAHEHGARPW